MKRTLSAILALIMLLGTLCAAIGCSDTSEEQQPATTTAAPSGSNVDEVTTDDLYDSMDILRTSSTPLSISAARPSISLPGSILCPSSR